MQQNVLRVSGQNVGGAQQRRPRRQLWVLSTLLIASLVGGVALVRARTHDAFVRSATTVQLEKALVHRPQDTQVRLELSRRLLEQGEVPKATERLEEALWLWPEQDRERRANVLGLMAEALLRANRSPEASRFVQWALRLDRNCVPAHLTLGRMLDTREMPYLSLPEYQIVTQLDPRNDQAWYLLGRAYNTTKGFRKAQEALERAIALNPRAAEYHRTLGDCFAYQGNFDRAAAAFQRQLEMDPNSKQAHGDIARAELFRAETLEEYERAVQKVKQVIGFDEEPALTYCMLGMLHVRFGKLAEAREALEKAVRLRVNLPEAFYTLSLVNRMQGDRAAAAANMARFNHIEGSFRACRTLEKRLYSDPENAGMRRRLAQEYVRAENWQKAMREYGWLLPRYPKDLALRQEAQRALAAAPRAAGAGSSAASSWAAEQLSGLMAGPQPPPR